MPAHQHALEEVRDDGGDDDVFWNAQVDGQGVDAVPSAQVVAQGLQALVPPELQAGDTSESGHSWLGKPGFLSMRAYQPLARGDAFV